MRKPVPVRFVLADIKKGKRYLAFPPVCEDAELVLLINGVEVGRYIVHGCDRRWITCPTGAMMKKPNGIVDISEALREKRDSEDWELRGIYVLQQAIKQISPYAFLPAIARAEAAMREAQEQLRPLQMDPSADQVVDIPQSNRTPRRPSSERNPPGR